MQFKKHGVILFDGIMYINIFVCVNFFPLLSNPKLFSVGHWLDFNYFYQTEFLCYGAKQSIVSKRVSIPDLSRDSYSANNIEMLTGDKEG